MPEFLPNFTFTPFTATIEETTDPLKLGRVRVRVYGIHNPDETEVPTNALPWAHVTYNDSNRMSVPTNGEWVIGFFLDGESAQKPIIIGTLPGINDVEPSTSKWTRNDSGDTGVSSASQYTKKTTQHKGTDITEPANGYGAKYPHNKVIETSSGHLIEIDDTPDKERIHIYHKSGSFSEFHQDGTKVDKTEKDKYTITLGKEYIAVTGDYKIEGGGGSEFKISGTDGKLSFKNTLDTTGLKGVVDDIVTILNSVITNLQSLDVVGVGVGVPNPGAVGVVAAMTARLAEVVTLQSKITTLLE